MQYLVSIGAPVPRSVSVANLFWRRRIHWRTVITAMRCGFPLIRHETPPPGPAPVVRVHVTAIGGQVLAPQLAPP